MFQDSLRNVRKQALANAKVQAMLAWLGARIRECRCDKQGRIKLDAKMLESVGIDSKLKLIGATTHIKICAPENWIEEPDNQDTSVVSDLGGLDQTKSFLGKFMDERWIGLENPDPRAQ